MLTRRRFLATSATALLGGSAYPARFAPRPKLTFYGSTQQVSGSCHLLETSKGLYLVDCGAFFPDLPEPAKENRAFPFDPKDVKAVFLTHAHSDHCGRLPLLYAKGFRGPIYCNDCTRDLTEIVLGGALFSSELDDQGSGPPVDKDTYEGALGQIEAIPYNTKIEKPGLAFRYTDAGHILGSSMVEVWIDGTKVLFTGDMGPDHSPILCKPTQHFGADAVLVESTYGPTPRDTIRYEDFGKKIMQVIEGGGSVLIPSFALHKTQCLIYIFNRLIRDGVMQKDVPIFSDSTSAQRSTIVYNRYKEYYDPEARDFGELFYKNRYREARPTETLKFAEPAVYISTNGMLDHAASPKHLRRLADDPKSAVFLIGYQAPGSVGKKLLDGAREIDIPIEDIKKGEVIRKTERTQIKCQVEKASGFSSHARGQQILEWLAGFERVGDVYVVHGDKDRATGLAAAARKMGLNAVAPKRGQSFDVADRRVVPGKVPDLKGNAAEPAAVDK